MELFLRYLASPLIAAIFTTLILWFKESKTEKRKHLNNVTYEQLTKVYNNLFTLYYQYNPTLKIQYKEEVYNVREDGEEVFHHVPHIEDFDLWHKVIKEVEEIVYPNIHLLTRKDIKLWDEYLVENAKTPESYGQVFDRYEAFHKFFKEISMSYIKLYNSYHMEIGNVKSQRKKRLKKSIKNIKDNPLMSKEEKKKKIEMLKEDENETLSKIV